MPFQPDQDPKTIEWARTPPPPLLEALETLYGLFVGYRDTEPVPDVAWWTNVRDGYQTAYNVMLRAFIEEYAP